LKTSRQVKYWYLKFVRLKGEPHELALGVAFGIFAGMLPIIPFQIALAVTLAIFFKVSKITAALGTWVSNPLNWYFLYYFCFKIGTSLMGISQKSGVFSSVMASIHAGEEVIVITNKILAAGGTMIFACLFGGFLMGVAAAIPSYFIFLRIFQGIKGWREQRRALKKWQKEGP
jgi:uncharacterized protein (DUF2062 family)